VPFRTFTRNFRKGLNFITLGKRAESNGTEIALFPSFFEVIMDEFFQYEDMFKSQDEIALENAVNNAIVHFQNQDFAASLPFIVEAIEICEKFGIGIPNLFLMKAFAEMQTGKLADALNSINMEIAYFPTNTRAYELKSEIEALNSGQGIF